MRTKLGAALIAVLTLGLPASGWADIQRDQLLCISELNPDVRIGGCTRLIQSKRFGDKDLAVAFNNRGLAYSRQGHYGRAIRDFDKAIRLRPDLAASYHNRGHVMFFKSRFADAIPDLKTAVRLSPTDHYAAIWLFLAEARAGRDGRSTLERAARNLDLKQWPGPVVAMFLGRAAPKRVLARAKNRDAKRQREQRTEAFFYVGQYQLLRGARGAARALFRAALELGVKPFVEYTGARVELSRMGK